MLLAMPAWCLMVFRTQAPLSLLVLILLVATRVKQSPPIIIFIDHLRPTDQPHWLVLKLDSLNDNNLYIFFNFEDKVL